MGIHVTSGRLIIARALISPSLPFERLGAPASRCAQKSRTFLSQEHTLRAATLIDTSCHVLVLIGRLNSRRFLPEADFRLLKLALQSVRNRTVGVPFRGQRSVLGLPGCIGVRAGPCRAAPDEPGIIEHARSGVSCVRRVSAAPETAPHPSPAVHAGRHRGRVLYSTAM